MTVRRPSTRVAVASVVLATGAALVGVGAAVAQSGDTPTEHANQGKSDEEHGKHLGWAKPVDNDSRGRHLGWDVHGQHGGAPESATEPPGRSGEPHGRAGEDRGRAGEKGKGAEQGKAGADRGTAGDKP